MFCAADILAQRFFELCNLKRKDFSWLTQLIRCWLSDFLAQIVNGFFSPFQGCLKRENITKCKETQNAKKLSLGKSLFWNDLTADFFGLPLACSTMLGLMKDYVMCSGNSVGCWNLNHDLFFWGFHFSQGWLNVHDAMLILITLGYLNKWQYLIKGIGVYLCLNIAEHI